MSDAPRWPGADGSPGLDFGRPAHKPGAQPSAPKDDVNDDATRKVEISGARDSSSQPEARPGEAQVPSSVDQPRPDFAGSNRRSQNADDWQLDSITRSSKEAQDAPKSVPPPAPPAMAGHTFAAGTAGTAGAASGAGRSSDAAEGATSKGSQGRAGTGTLTSGGISVDKIPSLSNTDNPTSSPDADDTSVSRPARATRRTRKARLRITRVDPWSVMKTAFLFSIAFGVMTVAAVAVLWSVFAGSDTLTYINDLINSVISDPQSGHRFDINEFLSWQRVIGLTMVLAVLDVVIFTAVATLFAFLYNLASVIMGGLEITLAED